MAVLLAALLTVAAAEEPATDDAGVEEPLPEIRPPLVTPPSWERSRQRRARLAATGKALTYAGGGLAVVGGTLGLVSWAVQDPCVPDPERTLQRTCSHGPLERYVMPIGLGVSGALVVAGVWITFESRRGDGRVVAVAPRLDVPGVVVSGRF